MKTYVCDACLKIISDPYEINMREFFTGSIVDEFGIWPQEAKCKKKIHICGDCVSEFLRFVRVKGLGRRSDFFVIDEMHEYKREDNQTEQKG